MKKTFLLLAFAAFCITSCDKNDDNSITTTIVSNTVTSGTWRVTYFWDTDHEETSNFNGYSFTFTGGNMLTAIN